MHYRVGAPFWKVAARLGVAMEITVCVRHDAEAAVYFAHSPDLKGLVVEARTLDELVPEVEAGIAGLMEEAFASSATTPRASTLLKIDGAYCTA